MAFSLSKLNTRERYAVVAGGILAGIFLIMQFIVFPILDNRKQLTKQLQAKKSAYEQMLTLKAEYDVIQKKSKTFITRFGTGNKNATLFSLLDKLAGDAGVKNNITSTKPSETDSKDGSYKISQVEIEFKAVTLEQLTKYLYMVETSREMSASVKRMSISRQGKEEGSINAILQVETIKVLGS